MVGSILDKGTSCDTMLGQGNKLMKTCITFLVIKEMQINTKLRYYSTPTRMAKIED